MVLDLNFIALYGTSDGNISDTTQRQLFSLCDGIVGGQGDGPLYPDPLALGVISFTNHSGLNDIAMAMLMGFDTTKIAMLHELENKLKNENIHLTWDNCFIERHDLNKYSIKAKASPGWEGFVN